MQAGDRFWTKANIRDVCSALYRAYLSPTKAKKTYSQCGEDAILMYLFKGLAGPGFYVDVGCHHPRRGSNTYAFYKKGWRGVLVDMEPAKTLACKLSRPRDTVVQAALSDSCREVDLYSPTNFSVLATINPVSVKPNFVLRAKLITRTLNDVLIEVKAPPVFELLSVDAEGEDLSILAGLDFSSFRPKIIATEVQLPPEFCGDFSDNKTYQFLVANNYRLIGWVGSTLIFGVKK